MALVSVSDTTYDWVDTAEGTDIICKDLAESKRVDYQAGIYTEEMFKADCAKIIADFEVKFDKALNISSDSLLSIEHSLDAWEHGEAANTTRESKGFYKSIGEILQCTASTIGALKDLERVLKESGVPIPDKVGEALNLLDGLAKSFGGK
jgi:hypothetical protein